MNGFYLEKLQDGSGGKIEDGKMNGCSITPNNNAAASFRNSPSVLDLLRQREYRGLQHRLPTERRISPAELASVSAWNVPRMQNMILAVGPGTPASLVSMSPPASTATTGPVGSGATAMDSSDNEHDDEDFQDDSHVRRERADTTDSNEQQSATKVQAVVAETVAGEDDDDDGGDGNGDDDDDDSSQGEAMGLVGIDDDDDDGSSASSTEQPSLAHCEWTGRLIRGTPSIRHGGCINTAQWMTSPWRISKGGNNNNSYNSGSATAVSSDDCPTQIITSGDDRLVKVWDASGAMGMDNPQPGGITTICPYSSPNPTTTTSFLDNRSGHVQLLGTSPSGHRANVFHATPLDSRPGNFLTCGADGCLRMVDLILQTNSTVVSHEDEDWRRRPGVCFSHQMLDANTGLLCSERGLKKFDVRLAPNEQVTRDLIGGVSYQTCKACAIWSSGSDNLDSVYVFAGGSSGYVGLYDLRMSGGPGGSKVVQHYQPSTLRNSRGVSVSGLDVSWDKRELLVSYENDQIYTFPVFPWAKSVAGPTLDEIREAARDVEQDKESATLCELSCIGGHLNRFTFLKNARYAGPRDNYICTGSDSGHAWIYERSTGSAVSLMKADNSTCNGVIPHPSLPFFVTYGIDKTAKLWRATLPVDRNVDDSPNGRYEAYVSEPYKKSDIVRRWRVVQRRLTDFADSKEETYMLPDDIPVGGEVLERMLFQGVFGTMFHERRSRRIESRFIRNELNALSSILSQNYFECTGGTTMEQEEPIRSGLEGLKERISLMRLRSEAEQRGLVWNVDVPWIMSVRGPLHSTNTSSVVAKNGAVTKIPHRSKLSHKCDLLPDNSGDWIPYDALMSSRISIAGGHKSGDEHYKTYMLERYCELCSRYSLTQSREVEHEETRLLSALFLEPKRPKYTVSENEKANETNEMIESDDEGESTSKKNGVTQNGATVSEKENKSAQNGVSSTAKENGATAESKDISPSKRAPWKPEPVHEDAWRMLYEAVLMLKNGGNVALQANAVNLAARRYDKAIRYCSIAFMFHCNDYIEFLSHHQEYLKWNGGHETVWTPLLKALLAIRLNLSLTLMKSPIHDYAAAEDQASQALKELAPFVKEKGKVLVGPKLKVFRDKEEPPQTFMEAKELQAKAYFRLGTAQRASGDFEGAVQSFDRSIHCTQDANPKAPGDAVVLRRLQEAKREHTKQKNRHRKKFKFMFSSEEEAKPTKSHEEAMHAKEENEQKKAHK